MSTGGHRRTGGVSRRAIIAGAAVVAAGGTGAGLYALRSGAAEKETPTWGQGDAPGATQQAKPASTTPAKPSNKPLGGGSIKGYPGRTMLGAYLDLKGLSRKQSQALRRKQLGRDERIVHHFYGFKDNFLTSIPELPKKGIPMYSWRGTGYEKILDGTHDAVIRRAAQRSKAIGKPMFMRWGWEMNGSWYSWGGNANDKNPAGYIDCWKYIRKIFKDQGADNVSWVWSPNWNSRPEESWNTMHAYYPGDEHVDWVGISGYPLYQETPETMYDEMYQKYADRKPMMITEVGSLDKGGYTKGDWTTSFYKYVLNRPNICAVTWFDTDTNDDSEERWKIDTDAHSLAAYKQMANDPRFAG